MGVELLGPDDAPQAAGDVPLIPFRDGRLKVAKGSNLRLKVRAALKAKVVPETCTIHYRTADGERGRVTMNRMKRSRDEYQQYMFSGKPLRGILSTVQFDVVGYDYRVRDYTIEVVDSPAIVGVELDCQFPAYLVDEKLGSLAAADDRVDEFHPVAAGHGSDDPRPHEQAAEACRTVQLRTRRKPGSWTAPGRETRGSSCFPLVAWTRTSPWTSPCSTWTTW